MSEFVVNGDMFGMYAKIPTGFSKEMYTYKIVSVFESNTYCDVPLLTIDNKETTHDKLDTVLNVIHCGIDESEVIRVTLKDCEVFKKDTLEIPNIPIQCVDGSCPMALSDEYEERGMDVIHSCEECQYNNKEPPKCNSDLISRKKLMKDLFYSPDGNRYRTRDCDNFPITISFEDLRKVINNQPQVQPIVRSTEETKQKLMEYFNIGDSSAYYLARVKEAFSIGTMTLDDFVEFTESDIDDLIDWLTKKEV